MKNIKIDTPMFIGALACTATTIYTATGDVQKSIHFSGTLNEFAFFGLCGITAAILFVSSISFVKK
jgi:hypothetical protein